MPAFIKFRFPISHIYIVLQTTSVHLYKNYVKLLDFNKIKPYVETGIGYLIRLCQKKSVEKVECSEGFNPFLRNVEKWPNIL